MCELVPLALFQSQDLSIQQYKLFPDDSVSMVMPKEVIPEPASLQHHLQEIREPVQLRPFPEQLILDASGGAMADDVIDFPTCLA